MKTLLYLFLLVVPKLLLAAGKDHPVACSLRELVKIQGPVETKINKSRSTAELTKIFNDTKELLIDEIINGKSVEEWNPYQKIMVDRIRSLKFQVKKCTSEERQNPGASNDLLTNTIKICGHALDAPQLALVMVLGHEIGHSLDIVNLGCRQFKMKTPGIRLESYFHATPQEATILKDSEIKSATSFIGGHSSNSIPPFDMEVFRDRLKLASDGNGFFNECAFENPKEKQHLDTLLKSNKIEIVDEGIPVSWHPHRKAMSCMAKNAKWEEPPTSQNQAEIGGYFTYGEKSAQIWGARALARHVRLNPQIKANEILGISRFVELNENLSLKGVGEKEIEIDTIYLAEPEIQKRLYCEPNSGQNCMQHFNASIGFPEVKSTGTIRGAITK